MGNDNSIKEKNMPTRTAPTVSGTPSYVRVSMSFIDAQGDVRSVAMVADAAVTPAQIEALAAAIQAASNASLYEISVVDVYSGARQTANADSDDVASVHGNIVYHIKASPTSSQRGYIPAPLASVFVSGTDDPDPANALLTAFFSATLAVAGGAYTGQTVRYTERRETNDAVKF